MTTTPRARNRRGEGSRLREEIVNAAAEILEESGDDAAITLRAVARRVGVTAPAIYAHFPDREAIVQAVLVAAFSAMADGLRAATEGISDPVQRLRAGGAAYLALAAEHPQRYRMLFQRRPAPDSAAAPADSMQSITGAEAFGWLVRAVQDCIDDGRSTSPSAADSALQIWVALHGFATLRAVANDVPWPEPATMLDALITRLAYLAPAATGRQQRGKRKT